MFVWVFHAGIYFLALYCGFMFLLTSPLTPVSVVWTLHEWNVLLVIAGRVRQDFLTPLPHLHIFFIKKKLLLLYFMLYVFSSSRQAVILNVNTQDSCLYSQFSCLFSALWGVSSAPCRCAHTHTHTHTHTLVLCFHVLWGLSIDIMTFHTVQTVYSILL